MKKGKKKMETLMKIAWWWNSKNENWQDPTGEGDEFTNGDVVLTALGVTLFTVACWAISSL